MECNSNKITKTIQHLLNLFVLGDFDQLVQISQGIRLTAKEMDEAIRDYGSTIKMPPNEIFDNLDVIEIIGSEPQAWSIRLFFWTEEDGVSDLSLELTLIDSNNKFLTVEIDNIHVS